MTIDDIKNMEWYKRGTPIFKDIILDAIGLYRPRIGEVFKINFPDLIFYTYTRIDYKEYSQNHPFSVGYSNKNIYMLKSDGYHCWIEKSKRNKFILLEDK